VCRDMAVFADQAGDSVARVAVDAGAADFAAAMASLGPPRRRAELAEAARRRVVVSPSWDLLGEGGAGAGGSDTAGGSYDPGST